MIGEILINKYAGSYNEPHKFTGYERDQESGLDYAHARPYSSTLSIFPTPDPHWWKYPGLSSYNYAGNNPIMRTDPTGETIYITGDGAEQTFNQLNASTSLKLKMVNGIVTATGKAKTAADQKLLEAINDTKIHVTVISTNANYENGERIDIGRFGGNVQFEDGSITALQVVNPKMTETTDEFYGMPAGTTTSHEVLEAYVGAQMHPNTKQPGTDFGTDYENYLDAHTAAMELDPRFFQPFKREEERGVVLYKLYDRATNTPLSREETVIINDLNK